MYTSFFDEMRKIAEAGQLKLANAGRLQKALRAARATYERAGGAGGRAMGQKASKAQHAAWVNAGSAYSKANPGSIVSKTFAGDKAKADKMYGFWNKYHKSSKPAPSAMGRLKGALGFKKTSSAEDASKRRRNIALGGAGLTAAGLLTAGLLARRKGLKAGKSAVDHVAGRRKIDASWNSLFNPTKPASAAKSVKKPSAVTKAFDDASENIYGAGPKGPSKKELEEFFRAGDARFGTVSPGWVTAKENQVARFKRNNPTSSRGVGQKPEGFADLLKTGPSGKKVADPQDVQKAMGHANFMKYVQPS